MVDKARPHSEGNEAGQLMFGQHIVTLIDFLGQQSRLAEWDFLPETAYDANQFTLAVRDTFGKIITWRNQFEKHVKLWLDSRELPESLVKTFPDGGRAYREFADTSLEFMHFSDTIVIYSPVFNQYGHANAGTVMAHLVTCGILMLSALNQDTVYRGAIEIGMAGQIDEAGIYGPALAAAHQLESKVAGYPRIMAGSRLQEYLAAQAANPDNSRASRANRGIANACRRLLGEDLDGKRILDYMGDGFVDLATKKDGWQMLREGALAFVKRELDRFRREGDQKLAERYQRMAAYCRSRGFQV